MVGGGGREYGIQRVVFVILYSYLLKDFCHLVTQLNGNLESRDVNLDKSYFVLSCIVLCGISYLTISVHILLRLLAIY